MMRALNTAPSATGQGTAATPALTGSVSLSRQWRPASTAAASSATAPLARRAGLALTSSRASAPITSLRAAPQAVADVETAKTADAVTPASEEKEQEEGVLAKFLVTPAWATAIIGRGGSSVRALSAATGCKVQISARDEYHPGTRCRILLLRGELPQIEAALRGALARRDELTQLKKNSKKAAGAKAGKSEDKEEVNRAELVMLVPGEVCGQILGRNATNLARLKEDTGAEVALESREKQGPGNPDRGVTISGTNEQVALAVTSILGSLVTGTQYMGVLSGLLPFRSVSLTVPNVGVGVIMGRKGEAILQLQALLGVSVSVSPGGGRNSGMDDNAGRVVTIGGVPRSVGLALQLVEQKVMQAAPQFRLPKELSWAYNRPPPPEEGEDQSQAQGASQSK